MWPIRQADLFGIDIGGTPVEEKYKEYTESLLNNHNFVYDTNISRSDSYSKIENLVSSLDVQSRVAFPSFVAGCCLSAGKSADGFFISAIFFAIGIASIVFSFIAYTNGHGKSLEDFYLYQIIPHKIKKTVHDSRDKKNKSALSELQTVTQHSISLIEAMLYRKAIHKSLWDDLYKSILKMEKLQKEIADTNKEFDYLEKELPKDYIFISDLKSKWK
jgi:hypothetical protein